MALEVSLYVGVCLVGGDERWLEWIHGERCFGHDDCQTMYTAVCRSRNVNERDS